MSEIVVVSVLGVIETLFLQSLPLPSPTILPLPNVMVLLLLILLRLPIGENGSARRIMRIHGVRTTHYSRIII